ATQPLPSSSNTPPTASFGNKPTLLFTSRNQKNRLVAHPKSWKSPAPTSTPSAPHVNPMAKAKTKSPNASNLTSPKKNATPPSPPVNASSKPSSLTPNSPKPKPPPTSKARRRSFNIEHPPVSVQRAPFYLTAFDCPIPKSLECRVRHPAAFLQHKHIPL